MNKQKYEIIKNRLKKYDGFNDECEDKNYNMAIHELCKFFLGENWYCIPTNPEQANTEIIFAIEMSVPIGIKNWFLKNFFIKKYRAMIQTRIIRVIHDKDVDYGIFPNPTHSRDAYLELLDYFTDLHDSFIYLEYRSLLGTDIYNKVFTIEYNYFDKKR